MHVDHEGAVGEDPESVVEAAERTLDGLDEALARLDAGSYGTCEWCGASISDERLAEFPTARTCDRHPQATDHRADAPG